MNADARQKHSNGCEMSEIPENSPMKPSKNDSWSFLSKNRQKIYMIGLCKKKLTSVDFCSLQWPPSVRVSGVPKGKNWSQHLSQTTSPGHITPYSTRKKERCYVSRETEEYGPVTYRIRTATDMGNVKMPPATASGVLLDSAKPHTLEEDQAWRLASALSNPSPCPTVAAGRRRRQSRQAPNWPP